MTFEAALATIKARAPEIRPRVGFILGSGLGNLADAVEGVAIDYTELPGFPHAGVSGHSPKLVIGRLEGVEVAVLGGPNSQPLVERATVRCPEVGADDQHVGGERFGEHDRGVAVGRSAHAESGRAESRNADPAKIGIVDGDQDARCDVDVVVH